MTRFRYAVLSDIHSNLTALVAVMNELDRLGPYDDILCMGDITGYGSNPNECIMIVEKSRARAIRGNHDRAVCGGDSDRFNSLAREAARYNASVLMPESRKFLERLSPEPYVSELFAMAHGSFNFDPENTYIFENADAAEALVCMTSSLG